VDFETTLGAMIGALQRTASMDQGALLSVLTGGLEAAFAILLALSMVKLASAAYGLTAPPDAEAVPLLHVLALGAGCASGAALLLALPHLDSFRVSRLFKPEGPWELGIIGFLGEYALPHRETILIAFGSLTEFGLGGLVGWLAVLLLAAGPFVALRWWDGRARLRALAAFLLLMLSTALMIHYAAHLLAWTAAQLNFWLFAVALFLWQRHRHAPARSRHGH
jgi:hypothetical protein